VEIVGVLGNSNKTATDSVLLAWGSPERSTARPPPSRRPQTDNSTASEIALPESVCLIGKLHVFADMYIIIGLKLRTLRVLKSRLSEQKLDTDFVQDFVNLLVYVYDHEVDTLEAGSCPLKRQATEYAIENFEKLCVYDSFVGLAERSGKIVRDILIGKYQK
jgi:hypothetical protein